MESPRSSRLSFYDSGSVIPSPIEGRKCGIAINVPKELRPSISLTLAGVYLPLFDNESLAYSQWPPCGPGHYELFLACNGISESRTVTVLPTHFEEEDFNLVFQELTDVLPAMLTNRLIACGAQISPPPARDQMSIEEEEFVKLRDAIMGTKERLGMMQILAILQRDCVKILIPKLEVRSVEKVRRPDISRLPQAMSMPGNVLSSSRLYQMYDTTVDQSFEAYENRLVKAYALALRSRLSRLQARLKAMTPPPAMTTEVDNLANEFHLAYMRATFLRSIRNASITSVRITMVLLKNPAYRAVLQGYLGLSQQAAVNIEEPALAAPLNNFPYLYQRWAGFKLLNALLQVCSEKGYRCTNHHWVRSFNKNTTIQVLNDGRPAVQLWSDRAGLLVSYVPWSPLGAAALGAPHPPTGVAIFLEAPGQIGKAMLFDPKYWVDAKPLPESTAKPVKRKTKRTIADEYNRKRSALDPLQTDVNEILQFKQQIRGVENASEIIYSSIMYPGLRKPVTNDIEALPAHPCDGESLHKTLVEVLRRLIP